MDSRYKEIEFTELKYINNLEYYKVYFKLQIIKIIKLSKKVIPKLKKIYKSNIIK